MCSRPIPEGTYELKIGDSFLGTSSSGKHHKQRPPEFHTLRYDFKPASVSAGSEAYIAESQSEESNNFQVIVPGDGPRPTIFKGAKKANRGDKECLLVLDRRTGELRLERVATSINVKKTRDMELDPKVRKEIERLQRKHQKGKPKKEDKMDEEGGEGMKKKTKKEEEEEKERTVSMSSGAGDEEDEGEGEDENVSALEQLMIVTSGSAGGASGGESLPKAKSPQKQNNGIEAPTSSSKGKAPSPTKKSRNSILAEDLQLSESSSEEEEDE